MRLLALIREFLNVIQHFFTGGSEEEDIVLEPGTVRWLSIDVPPDKSVNHFLAVGTTGSGKTTILRLLMQGAIPNVGSGDCRALVYDAKQDMVSILSGMVPMDRIVIMNPFDSRCARWDMAVDLDEPARFLKLLLPSFRKSQTQPNFFMKRAFQSPITFCFRGT